MIMLTQRRGDCCFMRSVGILAYNDDVGECARYPANPNPLEDGLIVNGEKKSESKFPSITNSSDKPLVDLARDC